MDSAAHEFTLRGPPELSTFAQLKAEEQVEQEQRSETDEEEEEESVAPGVLMGRTENNSATFLKSGSACLDFFFQIVPGTPAGRVTTLLKKAWEEDALTTLKLVFQLRGIRGTGKSDKLHFYDAARWLYEFHPQTLVANIDKVAPVGYFKDLLEMIQRILEGEQETEKRMLQKAEHKRKRAAGKLRNPRKNHSDSKSGSDSDSEPIYRRRISRKGAPGYFRRKGAAARAAKKAGTLKPREERIAESLEKDKREKENAEILRKNKKLTLASRVVEKYNKNPHFKALYDAVAKLFADTLAKDLRALELHKQKAQISLGAKWCPSLDSSYDKQTLLCEAIACRLFPKSSSTEYSQLTHHQYVYRARDKLRKDVLVPLREALELPEVYMSAKRWGDLPYKRVASVAMKTYKELFTKHDPDRFKKYLADVEAGKAKIAAGALLPHDILMSAVVSDGDAAQVAELQWKRMVEDLKQKGSLPNSLSVCDVSGSMSGTPMDVCIALGMLTAEISEEPWKGHVITFSNEPKLHAIQGASLKEKYSFTKRMPWGMNTDFQKVFDRILEMARASNLPPEKMIKRLFVFSDMEFDEATGHGSAYCGRAPYLFPGSDDDEEEEEEEDEEEQQQQQVNPWETDYMVITRKFEDAGYGAPPQIVFWNLRDSSSTPVTKDQPGVALVSGFSKNILKMFLDNAGDIDPILIMKQAISGKIYEDMKVLD